MLGFSVFGTYPLNSVGHGTHALDQIAASFCFVMVVLAVGHRKARKMMSPGLGPLQIGLGLAAVHLAFATNSGCAVNPARDLAPRVFTLFAYEDKGFK